MNLENRERDMSLDEAIQLANEGDIGVMIALGNHYGYPEDEDFNVKEALKWYEMAARKGNPFAVRMAALFSSLDASENFGLLRDASGTAWTQAEAAAKVAFEWAKTQYECCKEGLIDDQICRIHTAEKEFKEASYRLAVAYLVRGNYENVASLVENPTDDKSKLLYGFMQTLNPRDDSEFKQGVKTMLVLESKDPYVSSEKSFLEDLVMAYAAIWLAYLTRLGTFGGKPQLERSYKMLTNINQYLTYPFPQALLEKEMNRYACSKSGQWEYAA